jgi:hypothetical protein
MLEENAEQKTLITDHAFVPSTCYPDGQGCAHIVEGEQWSCADPNRCRRPEIEHKTTKRPNAEFSGRPKAGPLE